MKRVLARIKGLTQLILVLGGCFTVTDSSPHWGRCASELFNTDAFSYSLPAHVCPTGPGATVHVIVTVLKWLLVPGSQKKIVWKGQRKRIWKGWRSFLKRRPCAWPLPELVWDRECVTGGKERDAGRSYHQRNIKSFLTRFEWSCCKDKVLCEGRSALSASELP